MVSATTGPQGFGSDTGLTCVTCRREGAAYRVLAVRGVPQRDGYVVCHGCMAALPTPQLSERLDSILPMCDFCSRRWYSDELATLHAAASATPLLSTGDVMIQSAEWGVCPECRPFIEARDLTGLIAYVVDVAVKHMLVGADPAEVAAFRDLFRVECRHQYVPLFSTMRLPLDPPGSDEEGTNR